MASAMLHVHGDYIFFQKGVAILNMGLGFGKYVCTH